MNQIYFKWYEFDINVVRLLIATACIHNWSLQHFRQDYELVSHTTYVACVNFYT